MAGLFVGPCRLAARHGTTRSNPISSSGESTANLTSSIRRQSPSVVSLAGGPRAFVRAQIYPTLRTSQLEDDLRRRRRFRVLDEDAGIGPRCHGFVVLCSLGMSLLWPLLNPASPAPRPLAETMATGTKTRSDRRVRPADLRSNELHDEAPHHVGLGSG